MSQSAVAREEVAAEPHPLPQQAEARGRARSVPNAPLDAHPGPVAGVADAHAVSPLRRVPEPFAQAAGWARKGAVWLVEGESLLAMSPPSAVKLWQSHRVAAAGLANWPFLVKARLLWGLVHIPVVMALYGVAWVLFGPRRLAASLFIVAVWYLA